jgi:hypothetical protein
VSRRAFTPPPLGISDSEAERRFDALQAALTEQWRLIGGYNDLEQTMVVVPSVSLDLPVPGSVLQMYEERMLFLLLLLRKPRARIIYLSSQPILPDIIDYYMSLLPGVIPSHARSRLHTVPVLDSTSRPLTLKVLERPRLIERIRGLIPNPATTHLVPFNTTRLERDLAIRLGIPMSGCDPRLVGFGTKSGGRRLFDEEGIPQPAGFGDLASEDDCLRALAELRRRRPGLERAIVKLDQGVSGLGNAEVLLSGLPDPGAADEADRLRERLHAIEFDDPALTYDAFMERLGDEHGVVEERLVGAEIRSPSVQARNTPLGSLFPADPAYAVEIARHTLKAGERLSREGVLGRFALDFVTVRDPDGTWRSYAIEINLRKGGTTAPFLILEFLVHGRYDWEHASFAAPNGQPKFYVSDDHLEMDELRALTPYDVLDVTVRKQLHFDHTRQRGIVYQMLSAVTEQGRVGVTAVGDSPEDAKQLRQSIRVALREDALRGSSDSDYAPPACSRIAVRRLGSSSAPSVLPAAVIAWLSQKRRLAQRQGPAV